MPSALIAILALEIDGRWQFCLNPQFCALCVTGVTSRSRGGTAVT